MSLLSCYKFFSTHRNIANVGIYILLVENFNSMFLYGLTIPLCTYSFACVGYIWYESTFSTQREKLQWLYEFQHGIGMGSPFATTLFNIALNGSFIMVTIWFVMAGAKLLPEAFKKQKQRKTAAARMRLCCKFKQ